MSLLAERRPQPLPVASGRANPDALAMPFVEVAAVEMEALCLSWLEHCDQTEHPALLLSGGPLSDSARYHVLVRRPELVVLGTVAQLPDGTGGCVEVIDASGERQTRIGFEGLTELLRSLGREHGTDRQRQVDGVPFAGGFVGYFGYDLAWVYEYGLPRYLPPSSALPDLWLGWYDEPIVCDRMQGRIWGSQEQLDELGALPPPAPPARLVIVDEHGAFHREEYEAAVERVRQHCLRGDLFQADLSRRIALGVAGSPIDLFKQLVRQSPSAFSAYLALGGGRAVASSSPEEFLRLRDGALRTGPIKGTRPRGREPDADERLRQELMNSEKDLAELTMIVDLMRNDLGRVARAGTVRVSEFPVQLTLPQVFHLTATIEAELDEGFDFWDVLAASFPPGSISGAPKPKAIEILEVVERSRRGVYTGAIGYVEPNGNAHLNVAIRTAEWDNGRLRFGVGGGITVGSDPGLEFEETMDKARGLAAALGIGELR